MSLYFACSVLGVIFGSFVSFCSYRLFAPAIKSGNIRSVCPRCFHALAWFNLVPLFSFVAQKGKCSYCKQKISLRYPILEISQCILFCAILTRFGPTLHTVLMMLFSVTMLLHITTDIEQRLISVPVHYISLFLSILMVIDSKNSLSQAITCGIGSAFCLWCIGYVTSKFLKRKALGFGDVEIMADLSILVNNPVELIAIFGLSGVINIVFALFWRSRSVDNRIPFAPAMIISFFIEHLYLSDLVVAWFSVS